MTDDGLDIHRSKVCLTATYYYYYYQGVLLLSPASYLALESNELLSYSLSLIDEKYRLLTIVWRTQLPT